MTVTVSEAEGYEPIWGGFLNRFNDIGNMMQKKALPSLPQ